MSEAEEAPPAAPPRACHLVWTDRAGAAHAFDLAGRRRVTIGRGSRCDLVIRDTRISRHHATIEDVNGQHLLRDAASANGTFLNGLRLTQGSAFTLRAGDAIVIGRDRIVYAGAGLVAHTPFEEGARFALDDLVADGEKELSGHERSALDLAAHGTLAGADLGEALKRVLAMLAERVLCTQAVAFLEDERGRLRARAGRPSLATAPALLALAVRVVETGEGHLRFALPAAEELGSGDDTAIESETSCAAVPFTVRGARGALAVQRTYGERLDVRSLALIATIASATSRAIG